MNNEEIRNKGLKTAEEAEKLEGKGKYIEAAEKYKEAGRKFKECKRDDLFARCLVAHYASLVKYDCTGRRIEEFATNLSENFLEKIESELNKTSLDDFTKYDTLISAYREIEKIFHKAHMQEKADKVYYARTKLNSKYYRARIRNRNQSKKKKSNIKKQSRLKIFWHNIRDIFYSVMSRLFNWYCGHGEKPFKALFILLGFIFLFSLLFCGFGLIKYSSPAGGNEIAFPQAVYFSVVAFTTLGFGDIVPVNGFGQALVTIEVIVGYLMLGFLVAVFIRKMTR